MKTTTVNLVNNSELDQLMAVCCGLPRGDELPQVAGERDILMDVYSDILNMPREYASARFNHQYNDDFDFDYIAH